MNRALGTTNKVSNKQIQGDEEIPISSTDFLGGLITDADPATIPTNALQVLTNGTYIRNILMRRNGLILYSNPKPDSNKILNLVAFVSSSKLVSILRFTATTIYKAASGSGWVAITGGGLSGSASDYFNYSVADNRFFFTNNGGNPIQELDVVANTYAPLGNAPNYKYITSAFNRIVGCNLVGATNYGYQIGWSGDLVYNEWNPTVNITAGFTSLVNSPSDLGDDITGIFYLNSKLCITRQKSIWFGLNQPSGTNPFFFSVAIPKVGCDTPKTIVQTANGLIFYNFQLSTVYEAKPDSYNTFREAEIGLQIKRYLKSLIYDPSTMFATYSLDLHAYSIFIPNVNSTTVYGFTYFADTKNWTLNVYTNVSTCADLDYLSSSVSILNLVGLINALTGSINDLSGLPANTSRVFGHLTGEISVQMPFSGMISEAGNLTLNDWNQNYSFVVASKTVTIDVLNQYISKCFVKYTPFTTGVVTLQYSKDDGNTWNTYKSYTVLPTDIFKSKLITGNKFLNVRTFIWQITTTIPIAINNFNIILTKPSLEKGPISRK